RLLRRAIARAGGAVGGVADGRGCVTVPSRPPERRALRPLRDQACAEWRGRGRGTQRWLEEGRGCARTGAHGGAWLRRLRGERLTPRELRRHLRDGVRP